MMISFMGMNESQAYNTELRPPMRPHSFIFFPSYLNLFHRQLNQPASTVTSETITEVEEEITQPVHQTRQATRNAAQLIRTSDYSSEESLDRLKGHSKEVVQVNIVLKMNEQLIILLSITMS